tara:strand:- start:345 stop:473 length:129 start_codon:yes stop_codon:yes gene_type:complete
VSTQSLKDTEGTKDMKDTFLSPKVVKVKLQESVLDIGKVEAD